MYIVIYIAIAGLVAANGYMMCRCWRAGQIRKRNSQRLFQQQATPGQSQAMVRLAALLNEKQPVGHICQRPMLEDDFRRFENDFCGVRINPCSREYDIMRRVPFGYDDNETMF